MCSLMPKHGPPKTRYVPFRMTEEDYVWLIDKAAVLNVDVSEFIRRIIHLFRFLTEQPLIFLVKSYSDLEKEFGEEGVMLVSKEMQSAAELLKKSNVQKEKKRGAT